MKKIIEWFETHKAPPWWTGAALGATVAVLIAVLIAALAKGAT